MKFIRAAKVAAFLLTALLMVALIACPAGPPGPTGTTGDTGGKGDKGTTGDKGDAGLDSLQVAKIMPVIFNPSDTDANGTDDAWVAATTMYASKPTIDLSKHLTGGAAGAHKYEVLTVVNRFADSEGNTLQYTLDESTGKLKVETPAWAIQPAGGNAVVDDTVIVVEVTDAKGNTAEARVPVRLNIEPTFSSTGKLTATSLTIGTQDAATAAAVDYYGGTAKDDITCVRLNQCTINLARTDTERNAEDQLRWMTYSTQTNISAKIDEMTGLLTLTGSRAAAAAGDGDDDDAANVVYVWATDEGGLPVNGTDNKGTANVDESKFPPEAKIIALMVTVDGAPYMGTASRSAVSVGVGKKKDFGTVYDPEVVTTLVITQTPEIGPLMNAHFALGAPNTPLAMEDPNRPVNVTGRNGDPREYVVRITEASSDKNPTQWVEHTITVTTTPSGE